MDGLARRLGAQDTRVARPSGLDGPGMSTSAYDESLFFRAAMRKPLLTEIFSTSSYDFPGYGDKPGYAIGNDNRLLENYPGDLGGKTGYTNDALHTYVNAAKRHGHRVALVMMRGMNHLRGMYGNADKLMNYGSALEAANTRPVGHLVTSQASASASEPVPSPRPQYAAEESHTSATAAQQDPPSRLPEIVALVALVAVVLGTVSALVARRGLHR
jgi:D-alanyl-D-alanine carboxypeptidase (penicillin-binding protein 5/6)